MFERSSRIALGLAYSGHQWHGWQKQPHVCTIQNQLETAIEKFTGCFINTTCAGRTDAGVHAFEQVVHLDANVSRSEVAWVRALNSFLPESIRVQWAKLVSKEFHARFSAKSRSYVYVLNNQAVQNPFLQGQVGWVFRPLSLVPMQKAAQLFLGEHDFSAFRAAQCQAHHPVRHLQRLDIWQQGNYFIFHFKANAFLHHMIRNIMGVLIYIGLNREPVNWVRYLLQSKDRTESAPTFSPAGLYLAKVEYANKWGLPHTELRALLHQHLGISCAKV